MEIYKFNLKILKQIETLNDRNSNSTAITKAIGGTSGGIPVTSDDKKGVIKAIPAAQTGLKIKDAMNIGKNIGKNVAPKPNW